MTDQIEQLYAAILARRGGDPNLSRTARLLAMGTSKIAQKVGEEAVEVVIDTVGGDRAAVILESADLVYHLAVLWAHLGIGPDEVWREMARRQTMMGIAEKLPKSPRESPDPALL